MGMVAYQATIIDTQECSSSAGRKGPCLHTPQVLGLSVTWREAQGWLRGIRKRTELENPGWHGLAFSSDGETVMQ